jgi:hypothetical protein
MIQRRLKEEVETRTEELTNLTLNASNVTRKVTTRETAAREDPEGIADLDLDQDRQDGIEIEMIVEEEVEPQIDTTETEDTIDETGTEAEGLLLILDLTTEVPLVEEAIEVIEVIEETEIETTTEETGIEIDTLTRTDAEVEEERTLEKEMKSPFILQDLAIEMKEVNPDLEARTEERTENLEEKDLDPDLPVVAEKTQKDLEAPVPTNVVKEIKTVHKEKMTTKPLGSTKEEIAKPLKDPEARQEERQDHQENKVV